MRKCIVCKLDKDESEFYLKKKNGEKLSSYCKPCNREILALHYINNKETYKEKTSYHKKSKREWLNNYKKTLKCNNCNENHPAVLDFHHLDPNEKIRAVTTVVERNWSLKRIKDEIAKCIPLCSNCHRKLHWDQKHL